MNILRKKGRDLAKEVTELVIMHMECAAHILNDEDKKINLNIALYNLAVTVRISLAVACKKHKIGFADNDPIELLFSKTNHVLPREIAVMSKDISYWHDELPYVHEPVMSSDEGCAAGKKIQKFYNEYIVKYQEDLWREDELWRSDESTMHTSSKIGKF